MSISAISSGRTQLDQRDDRDAESLPQKPTRTPEFDFAGKMYAAVTLPHGLMPARPTVGAVGKDLSDFQSKLERVGRDLTSPGMREWFSKHAEASVTGTKIGLKLAAIVGSLLALKEKAALGAIGIEVADKALGAGDKTFGLIDDVKTFVRQLKEEHAAAKAAHPDVVRLENDLVEMVESGAKLAIDLRKLGGT